MAVTVKQHGINNPIEDNLSNLVKAERFKAKATNNLILAVENEKQWLQNWYDKRLPAIGKEHLKLDVEAGLQVPYQTSAQMRQNGEFLPYDYAGTYHIETLAFGTPSTNILLNSPTDGTPVHEFTHATLFGGKDTYNPEFTNGKKHNSDDPYLSLAAELHARIMQWRYLNNADPTKTNFTIEDIHTATGGKNILDQLRIGGMTDEDIQRALNTWASNSVKSNTPFQRNDGTYYAHFGGLLNYFDYFK